MNWFKRLIEKLFNKNKIKLIKEPEIINIDSNDDNAFIIDIKQQANLDCDDGNGYKIIPNLRLKDMV